MNVLMFTIAFDSPGEKYHLAMARILFLSAKKSGFEGDVVVFSNHEEGLFALGRYDLENIVVDTGALCGGDLSVLAKTFKFRARDYLDSSQYDKVLYVDCDCLIKGDVRSLVNEFDIQYASESWTNIGEDAFRSYLTEEEMDSGIEGINSGTWMLNSREFSSVMERWEGIYVSPRIRSSRCVDQPSWVRLVLDADSSAAGWTTYEKIRYPVEEQLSCKDYDNAVILHYCGLQKVDRLRWMVADFIRFHDDKYMSLFLDCY